MAELEGFINEEKELLLDKKMEAIRRRNEKLQKRFEEVEADKKHAEQISSSAKVVDDHHSVKPHGMTKRGAGRGKRVSAELKQNIYLNDKQNFIPRMTVEPPPDPVFSFLADRSRDGQFISPENQGSSRRHRSNWGGTNFENVKSNMTRQKISEDRFPHRLQGFPSKAEKELVMTGKERQEYDQWKLEREKIDFERKVRKERAGKKEWDLDKVPDIDIAPKEPAIPVSKRHGRMAYERQKVIRSEDFVVENSNYPRKQKPEQSNEKQREHNTNQQSANYHAPHSEKQGNKLSGMSPSSDYGDSSFLSDSAAGARQKERNYNMHSPENVNTKPAIVKHKVLYKESTAKQLDDVNPVQNKHYRAARGRGRHLRTCRESCSIVNTASVEPSFTDNGDAKKTTLATIALDESATVLSNVDDSELEKDYAITTNRKVQSHKEKLVIEIQNNLMGKLSGKNAGKRRKRGKRDSYSSSISSDAGTASEPSSELIMKENDDSHVGDDGQVIEGADDDNWEDCSTGSESVELSGDCARESIESPHKGTSPQLPDRDSAGGISDWAAAVQSPTTPVIVQSPGGHQHVPEWPAMALFRIAGDIECDQSDTTMADSTKDLRDFKAEKIACADSNKQCLMQLKTSEHVADKPEDRAAVSDKPLNFSEDSYQPLLEKPPVERFQQPDRQNLDASFQKRVQQSTDEAISESAAKSSESIQESELSNNSVEHSPGKPVDFDIADEQVCSDDIHQSDKFISNEGNQNWNENHDSASVDKMYSVHSVDEHPYNEEGSGEPIQFSSVQTIDIIESSDNQLIQQLGEEITQPNEEISITLVEPVSNGNLTSAKSDPFDEQAGPGIHQESVNSSNQTGRESVQELDDQTSRNFVQQTNEIYGDSIPQAYVQICKDSVQQSCQISGETVSSDPVQASNEQVTNESDETVEQLNEDNPDIFVGD